MDTNPTDAHRLRSQVRQATSSNSPRRIHHSVSLPSTSRTYSPNQNSRYIPALDGLRAFAVLVVIAYHMGFSWAKGGLLGVTIFFVLSGYLITSLLVREYRASHTINLSQFWLRRLRRIVPAILTVIIGVAAFSTAFNHILLTKMRPDILPSLFFFNNWWQIFHNVSYFEALGAPSPLTHFWSLAIEEQFYLIWPLILLLCFKLGARFSTIRRGVLILAALSAVAMLVLYLPSDDPSRVYYGTDTRAFSLLLGAWYALDSHTVLRKKRLTSTLQQPANPRPSRGKHAAITPPVTPRNDPILFGDIHGVIAFVALVVMMIFIDGLSSFYYYGGLLLASTLSVVLIAVLARSDSKLARVFSLPPFVLIGKWSYSMYLWHFPVILLIAPKAGEDPAWWMPIAQLTATTLCAVLSYYAIENPIRYGAIGRTIAAFRDQKLSLEDYFSKRWPVVSVTALASIIAFAGIVFVPNAKVVEDEALYQDENAAVVGIPETASADKQATQPPQNEPQDATPEATTEEEEAPTGLDVLLIGDSVSKKAIYFFPDVFPHGAIDAKVGRSTDQGIDLYQTYTDQGVTSDIVVFALGNNAAMSSDQVNRLIQTVGIDKHIFLVNTRGMGFSSATNAVLNDAAAQYSNVTVIDWNSASEGHSEYFEGDGVHINQTGAQAYTNMIYEAVKDLLPKRSADENAVVSHQQNDGQVGLYVPQTSD